MPSPSRILFVYGKRDVEEGNSILESLFHIHKILERNTPRDREGNAFPVDVPISRVPTYIFFKAP